MAVAYRKYSMDKSVICDITYLDYHLKRSVNMSEKDSLLEAARELCVGHRVAVTGEGEGFGSYTGYCTEIKEVGEGNVLVSFGDEYGLGMVLQAVSQKTCRGIMQRSEPNWRKIERVTYKAAEFYRHDKGRILFKELYTGINEEAAELAAAHACASQVMRYGKLHNPTDSTPQFDPNLVSSLRGIRFVVAIWTPQGVEITKSFGDASVKLPPPDRAARPAASSDRDVIR
jgi:hypothetical protein